jgi:hypothetical protein
MKRQHLRYFCALGSSLIEVVISMGVLAVVIPLVLCVLADADRASSASQAKTRSGRIIPSCLAEIHASRNGIPEFFEKTERGQSFPPLDQLWVLGFSGNGKVMGTLSRAEYQKGQATLRDQEIRYFAVLSASPLPEKLGIPPMMQLRISIEYPAAAPVGRRAISDFYTQLP